MSYAVWTPPIEPSPGTSRNPKYTMQEATFGDGYTQRTHVGINSRTEKLNLVWEILSPADADAIEGWFESFSAGNPFYYTPPNDTDGPPVPLWTVSEWRRTERDPLASAITATLTRVYDL